MTKFQVRVKINYFDVYLFSYSSPLLQSSSFCSVFECDGVGNRAEGEGTSGGTGDAGKVTLKFILEVIRDKIRTEHKHSKCS